MTNSLFKRVPTGKTVKGKFEITTDNLEDYLYSLNYYVVKTKKEEHISLKKLTYLQVKNLLGDNYDKTNIYIIENHLIEYEEVPKKNKKSK